MTGDPGYPDDIHQYDGDPRSPFCDDPTESPAFEDMKQSIYRERVQDINGYFIECFSESSDNWLEELSALVLSYADSPSDRVRDIEVAIGKKIAEHLDEYCTPSDDEVVEALEAYGDD
jgi:hypothetical protein